MNKAELIEKVAQETGVAKATAEECLTATLKIITDTMASGENVQLIGFGNFVPKERAGRMGRNPRTNEEHAIPAKLSPSFTAGKGLKDAVARRGL